MKVCEIYNAFAQGEPLRSNHWMLKVHSSVFEQLSSPIPHKLPYAGILECPQKGDVVELIVADLPIESQPQSLLFVILNVMFGKHYRMPEDAALLDLFPLTRQPTAQQPDNQLSFEQMLQQGGGTIEIDGQQVPIEFIDANGNSTILGEVPATPPENK